MFKRGVLFLVIIVTATVVFGGCASVSFQAETMPKVTPSISTNNLPEKPTDTISKITK
jgi:hypothetical protein